jgi:HK97 family phage portal protein
MPWSVNLPALTSGLQRALFGAEIIKQYSPTLPGDRGNWWWPVVREPYTGAWQRNIEQRAENILNFHAVYACIERIASDIAKCRLRLVEEDSNGIWREIFVPAFSPVIRKPNHYQNRIQFFEAWMLSKLMAGNTYVLKERDSRNVVVRLYVLDPTYVKPLVAPDGEVYYQLSHDNLAGLNEAYPFANSNYTDASGQIIVPSSEIIHDMMTLKHHHLCGLSPMAPAALAAVHGINIQRMSTEFFANSAKPSGVLTAPGAISEENAKRLKEMYESAFTGHNSGKVAVVGDGLKFESMTMDFVDAQLMEQLGISAKMVCSSFGVPPHMVQVGDPPSYTNIEALNQQYYTQTLQKHFEAIELALDEGLGLTEVAGKTYGTWFDLDDLLRMDTATLVDSEAKAVGAGIKSPNEARMRLNLGPTAGGKGPYLQQQNYSLEALAKRDAQADPFAPAKPPEPPPAPEPPAPAPDEADKIDEEEMAAVSQLANWELRTFLATG